MTFFLENSSGNLMISFTNKCYRRERLLWKMMKISLKMLFKKITEWSWDMRVTTSNSKSIHLKKYLNLIDVKIIFRFTFACRFGSNRNKQPIWADLVLIIPAPTELLGFGSIPFKSDKPKPESNLLVEKILQNLHHLPVSLFLFTSVDIGYFALNIFWHSCSGLKWN